MEQESAHSVLGRLLRKAGDAAVSSSVTPTRALRLSMARSAERTIGLNLSVREVSEEIVPLDGCLAAMASDLMLLAVGTAGEVAGLAAFDLQLRTAVVETQTVGIMRGDPAGDRRITATDAALCAPLVSGFLEDLSRTTEDTALEGWVRGFEAGERIQDSRAAGMILTDRAMRMVRIDVNLGGDARQGALVLALPVDKDGPVEREGPKQKPFADQFRTAVMEAPADLHAVLHRLRMPLREVEQFEVGQIISLPGINVSSVRLEGPNGACVGQARLGQMTGLRAVRIEQAGPKTMSEAVIEGDPGRMVDDPGALPMMEAPGAFGGEPGGTEMPGMDMAETIGGEAGSEGLPAMQDGFGMAEPEMNPASGDPSLMADDPNLPAEQSFDGDISGAFANPMELGENAE